MRMFRSGRPTRRLDFLENAPLCLSPVHHAFQRFIRLFPTILPGFQGEIVPLVTMDGCKDELFGTR